MSFRVATNASINRVTNDLTRTFQRMQKTQSQISSTKKLQRPSDSPTGVATALQERATQRRMEQYAASATESVGWLNVTDAALMGVQDQSVQAKVALASALSGAMDDQGREAAAQAIEGFKAAIVQLGNTAYEGRSVFAGTAAASTIPFDAAGVYSGDSGAVQRTIDDGVTLKVNLTGDEVFGAHNAGAPLSGSLFQILDAMSAAVRAGDAAAMQAASTAFSTAVDRVSTAQVHIGGVTNRVEGSIARNEMVLIDVKDRLSKVEDTDLAEALISLRSDEAGYQAALGVTAKVIQPTLMDFLR